MLKHLGRVAVCSVVIGSQALAQDSVSTASLRRARIAPWTLIDGIGYTGLGAAAGVVIAYGPGGSCKSFGPCRGQVAAMLITPAIGLVTGVALGHTARTAIASGRPISDAHRTWVSTGGILAGATLGSIAAIPLIGGSSNSGTPLGSDESTWMIFALGGAVAGGVYAAKHESDFLLRTTALGPYRAARGGFGLRAGVRF